jgi:hypothetical protein
MAILLCWIALSDGYAADLSRDRLVIMLQSRVQRGQAVSKEDIDGFFAELKENRAAAA